MGIRRVVFKAFTVLWLAAGGAGLAFAAAPDVRPGCDPEYMDAMEARAFMLGQRRVSLNQALIYKPDSVIEYSCFNQYVGFLGNNQGRRFSENLGPGGTSPAFPTWTTVGFIDGVSLDRALFEVVTMPMVAYLAPNFGHTYLGGQLASAGGESPYGGSINCQAMQFVWKAARCDNFINHDVEDFLDFAWYSREDPRHYPLEYGACPADTRIATAMTEAYAATGLTSGDEHTHFILDPDNNPYMDSTFYEEDPMLVNDILDKVVPGDCEESPRIKTGVRVQVPRVNGDAPWDEHICTIPACSYDFGGDVCIDH